MKKVAMDSQQVVRARLEHQSLLQGYMELQKDFDSKKRKLQMTKQKKETLLAEIRFLRRRHGYLVEMQSLKQGMEGGSVAHQNALMQVKVQGTDARKRSILTESDSFPVGEKVNKGKKGEEESFKKPLVGKRKAQYGPMNEKIITGKKKKKISWQDPVAVNV